MKLIVASTALLCLSGMQLSAQVCSENTMRGRYGVLCSGYMAPAPGADLVPAKILATCTSTATGQKSCQGTLSLGGMVMSQVATGQLSVGPDCVGNISYTQTINGEPGPNLNLRVIIMDGGKHAKAISTDQGTVLSCEAERLSLSF